MMKNSKQGSCLCGKVRYQVTDISPRMGHCHCKMCRKFHGAAFSTFGEVSAANFEWLDGESLIKSYQGENGTIRKFCGECGSSLIFLPSKDSGEVVEFSLGTLDSNIEQTPDAHIFIANKANWFKPSDDLPQYEQARSHE
jgi:hypothetical protein